ncbi:MAG: PQQ-dependent sugar dehydrogenase [Gemmatimonadetes bacterium]|nr:PQQ-dependent sugar dehydrogenase [Gemmatimonadota bacterium]
MSPAPIALGRATQVLATSIDFDGNEILDVTYKWRSSDDAIVTVDSLGRVTGRALGSATVTASVAGRTGTAEMSVTPVGVLGLRLLVTGLGPLTQVTAPPDDANRLFVVERGGTIRVIRNGTLLANPFLDISDLVSERGGEQGLLSIAFHPNYATNGFFYVSYTGKSGAVVDPTDGVLVGNSVVARYRVSADPDIADATSSTTILVVEQPFVWHNVGLLRFSPDGMLYIGSGDGGSGGDPFENGQNLGTLLGTILRIDVDGRFPYEVPADNPFVGATDTPARPEIWAYGLRNPWRFSFDGATGDLYIADVGDASWEEINVEPAESVGGNNYGWSIMEGTKCVEDTNCDQTGIVLPTVEYSRSEGCAVIGGHVYRGTAIPALTGQYVYGDFCSPWLRSFRYESGSVVDLRDWSYDVELLDELTTSLGEDGAGELYVATFEGNVYKIVPAKGQPTPERSKTFRE